MLTTLEAWRTPMPERLSFEREIDLLTREHQLGPLQCGFHGPGGLVVSEDDLRKAVVTAAVDEHKRWFPITGAEKEDNDTRFPDLVNYWLAGLDSSIRPDFLQALQAVTGLVSYGNLSNASLNTAIQRFNTADARLDAATNDVYTRSAAVDALPTDLTTLNAAVKAATGKVVAARRAVNAIKPSASNQAALTSAKQKLAEAKQQLADQILERDTARATVDALAKSKKDRATANAARAKLKGAASNWAAGDRAKARKALFDKSATTVPKEIAGLVEASLAAAHNSRADTEPWSGAFIGFCVRTAAMRLGLEMVVGRSHEGKDALLKVSRRHSAYILHARDKAKDGSYRAFDPARRKVREGDIICTDRQDFIRAGERQTLKGLKSGTVLHGDIVTRVEGGLNGFVEAIGGNVGHTVRRRRYPLDLAGMLIIQEEVLVDQEDDSGKLTAGGNLGPFASRRTKPTMLDPRSSFRVFALLSPVEECKSKPGKSGETREWSGGSDARTS